MATPVRTPRSIEAAAVLLDRFAGIEQSIAAIENMRSAKLAETNAKADAAIAPLLRERTELEAKLSSWWSTAGPGLTEGKRKSIELGGCMIGSRAGRAGLALECSEKTAIARLTPLRWAKPLLRTRTTLDRIAVVKALAGTRGAELKALGFGLSEGAESVYIERVEQAGTLG